MCDVNDPTHESFRDWVMTHIMSLNASEWICMPDYEQQIRRIRSEARDLANRVCIEANSFEIEMWRPGALHCHERESLVNRIISRLRV